MTSGEVARRSSPGSRAFAWAILAVGLVASGAFAGAAAGAGHAAATVSLPHNSVRASSESPASQLQAAWASLGLGAPSAPSARPLIRPSTSPSWTQVYTGTPGVLRGGSMVWDAADAEYVLFGGAVYATATSATWLLSTHTVWTPTSFAKSPAARAFASMTYDAADHYVVLFGGLTFGKFYNDTWKFSGGKWTNITPVHSPPKLFSAGMVYDASDGYVLLFGGNLSGVSESSQTWTFKAGVWKQLTLSPSPSARESPALGYDAKDGYAVLFGGLAPAFSIQSDTWNFSKGAWHKLTPSNAPTGRYLAAFAYDPVGARMVLADGFAYTGSSYYVAADTWTFSAGSWALQYPSVAPANRYEPAFADGQGKAGMVIYGGFSYTLSYLSDLWTFKKSDWKSLVPTAPAPRGGAMMAWDAADGYVVLYGGYNGTTGIVFSDTWKFVGGAWTALSPKTNPGPRYAGSMVYDAADGYILLFGGSSGSSDPCGTWTFLHGAWSEPISACYSEPVARAYGGIAYDATDGYVVMFGGYNATGFYPLLGDTWTYLGGAWSLDYSSPTNPSARYAQSMSYDSHDGFVVLFSGVNLTGTIFNDTWVFSGGNWGNFTSSSFFAPFGLEYASLIDDPAGGYDLLFGGVNGSLGVMDFSYAYTNDSWSFVTIGSPPPPLYLMAMAYDATDHEAVLFGGITSSFNTVGQTWVYKG